MSGGRYGDFRGETPAAPAEPTFIHAPSQGSLQRERVLEPIVANEVMGLCQMLFAILDHIDP